MCGIVGYIGPKKVTGLLIEGLKRLEYRGYDSAGVAVITGGKVTIKRSKGKLAILEEIVSKESLDGNVGIGHTRWATHGKPSDENAHPHKAGSIVVVHNGIIENYLELKELLKSEGHEFSSETDTEVISHLIYKFVKTGKGFKDSVLSALNMIEGSYALGILKEDEPDVLMAARNESPLILGLGDGEFFIASDIPAIINHTRDVVILDDGEVVEYRDGQYSVTDLDGNKKVKESRRIDWSPVMAEKGGYKHFMLKEIFEQPQGIIDTIRGRISSEEGEVYMSEINLTPEEIKKFNKITIVACGTSWHAGLVGKFMMESILRIPVDVELGSEFRYRDPIVDQKTLIIAITQSGETTDTLAAVKEGKGKGAWVISICNVVESSAARAADGVIYTHAGPEIGVASTKAFTTQLTSLYLLTLYFAQIMGKLKSDGIRMRLQEFIKVPGYVEKVLAGNDDIRAIARKYMNARDFLYLGRGINYPIALEGALKLKEISYIHAEGYPAGEMKHGPIALIDEEMPVVAVVTKNNTYEKVLSNIKEVKARNGIVIAVANAGDKEVIKDEYEIDDIIYIPETDPLITPIVLVVPLQLLAYHVADLKGTDVDQPRNLAKSVTVE
ncbi:MAG: glutamine--fructose-6-phosphate transaminase (isomerizing) [Deltaproteobacteria bacterium]|uniref:Glutamine--fructose-6-phosphate aminotransferase [isomerizing] n=1 Tax=Candidatus Zymogenus saltonus TaxID=2844893 RepID=A0A9D8KD15_9DELT|nr:glutamine--fructose-6-phosphate transaminase (isomerizing) [Candidatus Zymogenus saltonus]